MGKTEAHRLFEDVDHTTVGNDRELIDLGVIGHGLQAAGHTRDQVVVGFVAGRSLARCKESRIGDFDLGFCQTAPLARTALVEERFDRRGRQTKSVSDRLASNPGSLERRRGDRAKVELAKRCDRTLGLLDTERRERRISLTLPATLRVPNGLAMTDQQEPLHSRQPYWCEPHGPSITAMARVRLFASIREVAGTGRTEIPGATVADVMAGAVKEYGPAFAEVLATCKIWVNGEPALESDSVSDSDEVAVLPPVSGG